MTPTTSPNILLLRTLALISLGALVAALVGIVISAQAGAWLTLAFQATIILAAVLGALMGLKKFTEAPAMAAICIAGTFFVAGFLGYMGAGGTIAFRSLLSGNLDAFNPGKLPTWIFLLDLGAAASIGAIAGLFALGRSPRQSWKLLLLGAALGAPVVIGGAVAYKIGLTQRLSGLNMIVATLIVVVLFVVVIGLISASANAIIGAFAAGLPDLDNPSTDPETPADAKPKANNTPPKPKPV